jgi:DNA-binding transcriptional LysR family regulator
VELRNLITFIAVAEKRSFIQAARRLNLSQPAVSAQIQRLEGDLGLLLFDRDRRSVKLTLAGEAFLAGARITLNAAENAAQAAHRAASISVEQLRFGFPSSASREIVPAIVTEMHRHYPRVKIDILLLHTSVIVSDVQSQSLDVGIVRLPVEAEGLDVIPAHREPFIVCLPAHHRLAESPQISIADLRDEAFIVYGRKWAPGFCDRITNRCLEEGFSPVVSTEVDEMYVAPALVAAGKGIAIVPRMVISSPIRNVVFKELALPDLSSQLGIVTRTLERSPIVRAAVAISKDICESFSVH